jgi:hypothetical protein
MARRSKASDDEILDGKDGRLPTIFTNVRDKSAQSLNHQRFSGQGVTEASLSHNLRGTKCNNGFLIPPRSSIQL